MKNIAVYCRFSSASDGADSLLAQWQEGKLYCEQNGYNPVQYNEGGGTSGGLVIEERKVGAKLLEDIKSNAIQGVYVRDLTRLVRNDLEGLEFRDTALIYKLILIERKAIYNLSNRNDALLFSMNNTMGYYERLDTTRRIKLGLIRAYERGELAKGKPIFGYIRVKKMGGGFDLHINEDEANIIIKVMNRFLMNDITSFKDMVRVCASEYGFKRTQAYYGTLFKETIKKYNGEWYNEFFIDVDSEDKKLYKINAPIIVNDELCEKVISKTKHLRISKARYHQVNTKQLYAGSKYCGCCGRILLRLKVYKTKMHKGRQVYDGVWKDTKGNFMYKSVCRMKTKNKLDEYKIIEEYKHTTSIYEHKYDEAMRLIIAHVYQNSELLKSEYKKLIDEDVVQNFLQEEIEELTKQLDKLSGVRKRLNEIYEFDISGMSLQEYQTKAKEYSEEYDRLEKRREIKIKENKELNSLKQTFGWKLDYSEKYSEQNFSTMGYSQFKEVYDDLVDRVEIIGNLKGDGKYIFKVKFKFNIVNDSFGFDKEKYWEWRNKNPNIPTKIYKQQNKILKVFEGNKELEVEINDTKSKGMEIIFNLL